MINKCPICQKVLSTKDSKTCRNHRKLSAQHRQKLRKALGGKNNPRWKGDDVGYMALHAWVRKILPKPEFCQECKKVPPLDLANKGIYNRELKNWEWLCRSCHMRKDGRLLKLCKRFLKDINCFVCNKVFFPRNSKTRHCCKRCANITNNRKSCEARRARKKC